MGKRKLIVYLACLFSFWVSTTCFAAAPLRVAILPVINQSYTYDDGVEKVISDALANKFSMPLSQVASTYYIVPAADVKSALPDDLQTRTKAPNFDVKKLRETAAKLNADVVVGAVITDFSDYTTVTWDSNYMKHTALSVQIMGYYALEGKTFEIKDHEDYAGELSNSGDADYLARVLMERLMNKLTVPKGKG